jgi:hypothetical protein
MPPFSAPKKIEEGLKDIRAGRTMALSDYKAKRSRKKVRKT